LRIAMKWLRIALSPAAIWKAAGALGFSAGAIGLDSSHARISGSSSILMNVSTFSFASGAIEGSCAIDAVSIAANHINDSTATARIANNGDLDRNTSIALMPPSREIVAAIGYR
jgi:hypothetical protein